MSMDNIWSCFPDYFFKLLFHRTPIERNAEPGCSGPIDAIYFRKGFVIVIFWVFACEGYLMTIV